MTKSRTTTVHTEHHVPAQNGALDKVVTAVGRLWQHLSGRGANVQLDPGLTPHPRVQIVLLLERTRASYAPELAAYEVTPGPGGNRWTRVGTAHRRGQTGQYDAELDRVPGHGRLVFLEPRVPAQEHRILN